MAKLKYKDEFEEEMKNHPLFGYPVDLSMNDVWYKESSTHNMYIGFCAAIRMFRKKQREEMDANIRRNKR